MASRAESWRLRIGEALATRTQSVGTEAPLLDRIIGEPSVELIEFLARPCREAAVLVGLIDRGRGPRILLTERAAHLPRHPGQISFPGGQLLTPDEDPVAAALREADEEVGLSQVEVAVLGRMPAQRTVTGFRITPIVGWIDPGFRPRPEPGEVESVFELPLDHALAARNRRRETRERLGTRFSTEVFLYGRHAIWGATAAILDQFIRICSDKTNS